LTPTSITEVPLGTTPLDRFETLIGSARQADLQAAADRVRALMEGRTFWHVNSTAKGGGVAELLTALLPYVRGAGIDTRWLVIDGDDDFFTVSKRIHNQLHGSEGDGDDLGADARRIYEQTLARNTSELSALLRPGDVVLFHDPQTAGLIRAAKQQGAAVVWRCHVGVDEPNDRARSAWEFLRPHVNAADRWIFTCRKHVWEGLDPSRTMIVPPSIDAFTPKNQDLAEPTVLSILVAAGILAQNGRLGEEPVFVDRNNERRTVRRRATMRADPIPDGPPLVVQVSRWDTLKDPLGVMAGFVEHVAPFSDAHLVLAGPAAESIDDDPEQAETLADVNAAWDRLEPAVRQRVHVVSLPMDDEDENAAMVNALQQRAAVVVQKSLAEGFGLTVAEAMWKRRPVIASARGGITEQITHDDTGVLVQDPCNLAEYGGALRALLDDPVRAAQLGDAAHRRVTELFLAPREIMQHLELVEQLVS
jgi:trehalose synthase